MGKMYVDGLKKGGQKHFTPRLTSVIAGNANANRVHDFHKVLKVFFNSLKLSYSSIC